MSVIELGCPVFGLSLHPSKHLVAAGNLEGHLFCYDYETQPFKSAFNGKISDGSLRAVEFNSDGSRIYTASMDTSISHVETSTGRVVVKIPNAHQSAINALTTISQHVIATGDEDGCIKLWDTRNHKNPAIHSWHAHKAFISQLYYMESKHLLFSAGGDGILTLYDPRKVVNKKKSSSSNSKQNLNEPLDISDSIDEALLCILPHHNNTKLLMGAESGNISIFEWDEWITPNDTIKGHPASVNQLIQVDEKTILSGGGDGLIRVVETFPHKVLGLVEMGNEDNDGGEEEGELEGIEAMRLSFDRKWLVIAQGDGIGIVDVEYLFSDEEEEMEGHEDVVDVGRLIGSINSSRNSKSESSDSDDDSGSNSKPQPQQSNTKRPVSESESSEQESAEEEESNGDASEDDKKEGRKLKLTRRQRRRLRKSGSAEVKRPRNNFFAGID